MSRDRRRVENDVLYEVLADGEIDLPPIAYENNNAM